MKKLSTALFCVIYCLSIIGGMFAVAPVAVAETSAAPERVGEVLTRREKNSDTYLLEDGSYECVVYSQDKYYENEYGRLEEIDNTIVAAEYSAKGESYSYANKAGGVNYRFSDNKAAVSIDTGKAAIAFSVSGGRGTTAKAGGDDKTIFDDYNLSGENYISYPDVADWDGFFDYTNDLDFYAFIPNSTDDYTFSASPYYSGGYIHLRLYNKYGVQIAYEVNYASPSLTYYMQYGEKYYIRVSDDFELAGRYRFTWTRN